jgi:hypothetical protein
MQSSDWCGHMRLTLKYSFLQSLDKINPRQKYINPTKNALNLGYFITDKNSASELGAWVNYHYIFIYSLPFTTILPGMDESRSVGNGAIQI